jgi:hypothetical protein
VATGLLIWALLPPTESTERGKSASNKTGAIAQAQKPRSPDSPPGQTASRTSPQAPSGGKAAGKPPPATEPDPPPSNKKDGGDAKPASPTSPSPAPPARTSEEKPVTAQPPRTARGGEEADAEKAIIELYRSGKLFDKAQYRLVRAAFTKLFESRHAEVIARAYGDDRDRVTAWLIAHPDIKEDFYTALDEQHDKLEQALGLFKEIWRRFPKQTEKLPQLTIATAVTWDDAPADVYDYRVHQERTHSIMPGKMLAALDNFQYVVDNEAAMEGRIKILPWEFLIFVIDHRTPLAERGWAQGYYKSTRGRVHSWHQDVPYDYDMLEAEQNKGTSELRPHLQGKEYTLANIRKFGGVCAMQADFAARVAKSVGIPAVYCFGPSAHRGLHAWWMYVQILQGNGNQIRFNLLSDGRFSGKDLFYTGEVVDPHTGQHMLDRDMERRLWVVGRDLTGKRQAELLMRAYSWLGERLGWNVRTRLAYLDRTLQVSRYNEDAWTEFGRLVRDGDLQADQKQVVLAHLASLSKTFAAYPDFVRKLLDDLVAVQPDPGERIKLYEHAVKLFESGGRADLACNARLQITDLLCDQKKWKPAAQGLIVTVKKFPTEGRYVPRMTRRLQDVCRNYKGGTTQLAQLYLELVPAMLAYYVGDESDYTKAMYEQALAFLQDNQLDTLAAQLRAIAARAGALQGR